MPKPYDAARLLQYQTTMTPLLLSADWEMLIRSSRGTVLANSATSSHMVCHDLRVLRKMRECTLGFMP